MTTVFRTDVYGRLDDKEPAVWTSSGVVIDVEGTAFVRLASGSTLLAFDPSWSTTAGDAKRRAAEQLDAIASRIIAKAAALRSEADATANTGSPS